MRIAGIIVLFLLFVSSTAHPSGANGCPHAKFSNPSVVSNADSSSILITHPSTAFDFSRSAKDGIDRLNRFGKDSGITSVYLQNSNLSEVYTADCEPDFWASSQAGEFAFLLSAKTVYFGGGYWEACQDSTFSDVIRSWAAAPPKVARLIQVMDAIYVSGSYVYVWDEFYPRYQTLLAAKPRVERPNEPTITLSELMSLMRDDAQRIEMLSRNLPNFGYLPADFEIQFFYNGNFIKQLRAASSPLNQKLFRIEFVETTP